MNGCKRDHCEYISFIWYPVDQVFRDHNGFRLIYTDPEGLVIEKKYKEEDYPHKDIENIEEVPEDVAKKFRYLDSRVKEGSSIIKDLKEGEKGFANVLLFNKIRFTENDRKSAYVEVHIPINKDISPGNEVYGGKYRIENPLHEVK